MKKAIFTIYNEVFVMKFEHNEKFSNKKKRKIAKKILKIFDAEAEINEIFGLDDLIIEDKRTSKNI